MAELKIKNPYVDTAADLAQQGDNALPGVKSRDTIAKYLNTQVPAGNVPGKALKKHAYLSFFKKLAADMGMALPSESSVQPSKFNNPEPQGIRLRTPKIPGLNQYTSYANPGGTQQISRNNSIGVA
jgi:hypothetical protein